MAERTEGGNLDARVEVLGPMRLIVDGATIEITRAKVRAALALLAAHARTPVSSDALIDHLWPESMPKDPRAALSVVLSRLRTSLGDARDDLIPTATGHQLNVDTDLVEFRNLIAQARSEPDPAERATYLAQALELWRDLPFQGSEAAGTHLESVAAGLAEQRWNAVSLHCAALFELGSYESVLDLALPFATQQPHREQLVATCARTLGLSGRKTEALRLIERSRSWLRDEMGLDSGDMLGRLEQDILQGAVDLAPPAPPTESPESESVFVNRDSELAQLHASSGFTLLTGEPGIGKSALLARAAKQWAEDGKRVVSVRAPASSGRPMEALGKLFEQLIEIAPPDDDDNEVWVSLARVVPSIAKPKGPSLVAVTKDTLVASLARYVTQSASTANAVIVLDDVQWLDLASMEVVAEVAEHAATRVIALARSESGRALRERFGSAPMIELQPLAHEYVRALIGDERTQRHDGIADDLWRRSGGNPLFLTLLLALIDDGVNFRDGLPASALVAVRRRLDGLSKRSQATLEQAALIGAVFSLATLRQLAPTADADVTECAAHGLVKINDTTDTGEFVHAIVRDGVRDLIPEGHRISMHDQIGQILEFSGEPASTYATHYEAAASLDPVRAARALYDAASEYARLYAWDDVDQIVARTKDLYFPTGDPLLEARFAVLEGNAQRDLHRGGSDAALRQAVETARELNDSELFVDAVIALCIHGWAMDADTTSQPVDLIEEAVGLAESDTSRIRVLTCGATLMQSEHHEHGRALYQRALDLVLEQDDATLQAEVLSYAHWGLSHPADLAALEQAMVLYRDVAGTDSQLLWSVSATEFALGVITLNPDLVTSAMNQLRLLAKDFRSPAKDWELAHKEAAYAHLRSAYAKARDHLERAREIGLATTSPSWVFPIYGVIHMGILRSQERLPDALPLIDQGIEANPAFSGWHSSAAAAAASAGDLQRARRELDQAFDASNATTLRPAIWTVETAILADAVCALEDEAIAAQLYELIAPFSRRMTWGGVCTFGPIDDALAALATVIGDDHAAQRHASLADEARAAFADLPE